MGNSRYLLSPHDDPTPSRVGWADLAGPDTHLIKRPLRRDYRSNPASTVPVCATGSLPNIPLELGAPQGEDCLSLNVWASSDTEPGDAKPVMVWLHGGAYVLGSSSQAVYDGQGWRAAAMSSW